MTTFSRLGRKAAVTLCEMKKVAGQKDAAKLQEIKDEVYKKGFYDGVLIVGPHAGKKVTDVKNIIRDELIAKKEAVQYFEPEKSVVSRSGDECVVAYMNQWYLDYGEESWRQEVEKFITSSDFHTYSPQVSCTATGLGFHSSRQVPHNSRRYGDGHTPSQFFACALPYAVAQRGDWKAVTETSDCAHADIVCVS